LTNIAANVVPNLMVFGQRFAEISSNTVHCAFSWPTLYVLYLCAQVIFCIIVDFSLAEINRQLGTTSPNWFATGKVAT